MAEIHLLKMGNGLRNFPKHHVPRQVQLLQFRHIKPQFPQIELQLIPRRIKPPHIIRPVQQPHRTPCYVILRQIDIIVEQILLRLPIIQVEIVVRQVQCLGVCHVHFWKRVLQGVVSKARNAAWDFAGESVVRKFESYELRERIEEVRQVAGESVLFQAQICDFLELPDTVRNSAGEEVATKVKLSQLSQLAH
nr:hypothetical protein Iba_chr12bCG18870 [Ipomoea batatas]